MKLRRLERQLPWPHTIPPQQLRRWVIQELAQEAPLLRLSLIHI